MIKTNLTPKLDREAKALAEQQAMRIKIFYNRGLLKSWNDVDKLVKLTVPENFRAQPFNFANVSTFSALWRHSYLERLEKAVSEPVEAIKHKFRVEKPSECSTFGKITLMPEQQPVFRAIYEALFPDLARSTNPSPNPTKAALQDGLMGSGKTYIAVAVIAQAIKDGILNRPDALIRIHPFIIFTPKNVVEQWMRVAEDFGLNEYLAKRKILVTSDSVFSSNFGRAFISEHEDMISAETKLVWSPLTTPYLAILDECHRYVNHRTLRTKAAIALTQAKPDKKFLFLSATPFEKVNDAYLFSIACDASFLGQQVTPNTFRFFAGMLDKCPEKPNREAIKRLRNVLSPYIFSLPYIKPKHKAVNVIDLVEFRNEKDKSIYHKAHEFYIKVCEKSGKNTDWGQFEKFIALNNFRKTVEPLRGYHLASQAAEHYRRGDKATVIFTMYKETIVNVAFELVDKYKIPRNKISIIWGGKKEYKPEDLLSQEELDSILNGGDIMKYVGNKELRRKLRITLRYFQDKEEHAETVEEQAYRHNKLKELRLVGRQSDNARQTEIDNFQDGTTTICLATLASGGVGLSLDKNKPSLLTREGYFTPSYSGKEFQQALGRLVRRASLADAIQHICMMRDTVEEHHVAPILDNKLKCIAEVTNRSFDIIDLIAQPVTKTNRPATIAADESHIRTLEEAAKDADNDDTIVSDFVRIDEDEDEDEDDTEN